MYRLGGGGFLLRDGFHVRRYRYVGSALAVLRHSLSFSISALNVTEDSVTGSHKQYILFGRSARGFVFRIC